jgi:hypothetical protein
LVRDEIDGTTDDWRACVDELATECASAVDIDGDAA